MRTRAWKNLCCILWLCMYVCMFPYATRIAAGSRWRLGLVAVDRRNKNTGGGLDTTVSCIITASAKNQPGQQRALRGSTGAKTLIIMPTGYTASTVTHFFNSKHQQSSLGAVLMMSSRVYEYDRSDPLLNQEA